MKTFVFVACLLIAVSATDLEKVKAFFETYEECSKELELVDQINAKAFMCLAKKADLYDKNGIFDEDKTLAFMEVLFITGHEEQGKKIILKCIDEGQKNPGNSDEKNIVSIECCLREKILDIIPKSK
ncbi:hypothetical protein HN011_011449 [Eciton burchellii]|nr:hypothetical protein HN011_011449 [Eciton burchellii]